VNPQPLKIINQSSNPHPPLSHLSPLASTRYAHSQQRKEIYGLSTFNNDDEPCFGSSIWEALEGNLQDDVHSVWALSKDFGSSGLRFGSLVTCNTGLLKSLSNISVFGGVSHLLQNIVAEALGDETFVDQYLEASREGLKEAYDVVTLTLEELGIPFVVPKSGM
jgi:aspartate/methionine/tyrosine aminotransferase